MKQKTFVVSALALAISSVFTVAQAAEDAGSANKEQHVELEKVVVIGSSRADSSGGLDTTAPVHLISAAQLQETNSQTLNEALSRLDPSFNFPQGQNAVKGQGVRSASLRGVSPAYTLILVNGKRRHSSAQLTGTDPWPAATVVDINTIPISAVERVEILKDGAAAQYGTDAIAGVVNIVLKNDNAGGEVNARYGGYSDGGGGTQTLSAWKGFALSDRGSLTLSADWLDADQVNRTSPDWRQLFPNGDARNGVARPDKNWKWGQSSREYGNILANAELEVAPEATTYGWVNYAHRSSNNYINPERVVKSNNSPTAAVLATAGPTTPGLINQNSNLWLYPNGFQPDATYIASDLAAVAGFRFGNENTGKFDLALSHGRNETRRYANNTTNPSWGANSPTSAYLGSYKGNQTNVSLDFVKKVGIDWLKNPLLVSAGVLARHEYWGTGDVGDSWTYTRGSLYNAGIRTVGQLYTANPGLLPAGLSVAQQNAIKADTTLIPTVTSFAGQQGIDSNSVTRNVKGFYVGGETDLTDRLQVGVTGRYEDYSDFGNTTNGKVTGRYELNPQVAFRGTASTGFHAPSLAQLGYQTTGVTGNLVNGGGSSGQVPGYTHTFFPSDPVASAFGAKALSPEKSTSFSIGTVLKPTTKSSITIDAYYLEIKDAIQVSESLSGNGTGAAPAPGTTVVGNIFNTAGLTGYTTASYYLNAWNQITRGIDIVGKSRLDKVLGGNLDLSAALSILDTRIGRSSVKRNVTIGGNTFTAISDAKIRDVETGTPRNKLILAARYTNAEWAVNTTVTRYGTYRYNANGTNGIADQVFSSESYLDLDVAYNLTRQTRIEFGAKNAFNRYPDAYNKGNRQSGVNEYSFIAPNGSAGRFIYAGINYAFL